MFKTILKTLILTSFLFMSALAFSEHESNCGLATNQGIHPRCLVFSEKEDNIATILLIHEYHILNTEIKLIEFRIGDTKNQIDSWSSRYPGLIDIERPGPPVSVMDEVEVLIRRVNSLAARRSQLEEERDAVKDKFSDLYPSLTLPDVEDLTSPAVEEAPTSPAVVE